jgi:hypothetical protein
MIKTEDTRRAPVDLTAEEKIEQVEQQLDHKDELKVEWEPDWRKGLSGTQIFHQARRRGLMGRRRGLMGGKK